MLIVIKLIYLMRLYASLILCAFLTTAHALIDNNDETTKVILEKEYVGAPKPENDPRFKPIDSHYLTFPVL